MTVQEFSNGFDTLVSSYRDFGNLEHRELLDSIEFDEYEKSLFLTLAQDEVVVDLYSGRNYYGLSFESTEEARRYLDVLVKDAKPEELEDGSDAVDGLTSDSKIYELPDDLAFIVYEQITLDTGSTDCANGSIVAVQPMTHDEFHKIRKNPFRGPTKSRAIRLDVGGNLVEIVYKYNYKDYRVRYLSIPEPIILENMPQMGITYLNEAVQDGKAQTCKLPELLHKPILERAVQMALISKGIRLNS